jgi:hypothetical protein
LNTVNSFEDARAGAATLRRRVLAMIQGLFHFILFLTVTTRAAAAVGERGYLAIVGPPELRFIPARITPNPPPLALPPLASPTSAAPATNLAPAPTIVETISTPTPTPPEVTPAEAAPTPTPSIERLMPQTPAWGANESHLPQSQMFLHYFTPEHMAGSNSLSVSLPIGFAPPEPRVSSKASYQVISPPRL